MTEASTRLVPPYPVRGYGFSTYVPVRNYIGGELTDAASRATLDVVNPRHGKVMGVVADSAAVDVDAAVAAARAALPAWRQVPMRERAQVMYRLKAILERDLDELSWLLSAENGKTYAEARGDIEKGIECIELAASLPNLAPGGQLDVSRGINCQVTFEPVGVVAGITPYNFPMMVPLWTIPNALVAGNTYVLKPSELVPYGALRLCMALKEAGLPDGVFNVVHGGRVPAEAIVEHSDVEAVTFVGSTRVGKMLYGRGTALGKRMLCLGSAKNHLLVVPDADPDLTAATVVASAFGCAGQRCMAATVMVAVGDVQLIIDRIAALTRDIKIGTDMGAIISRDAVKRITGAIAAADGQGAQVLVDGRNATVDGCPEGYWVGPTVIDNVAVGSPAACDEIFGPVLSVVHTATLDEALAVQNKSCFGNGAAIFTRNGGVARYAVERLQAGMVGVNVGVPVPREPFAFGGWKQSKFGHGDVTGLDGFRFFTQPRKVTTRWSVESDRTWMS